MTNKLDIAQEIDEMVRSFHHRYINGNIVTYPTKERFWAKVMKSAGCWEWIGAKSCGYGTLRVDGKDLKAHRLAWEWSRGSIPTGLCVCHKCDNRSCVRPSHLFLGTQMDNATDKMQKGRGVFLRGQKHHWSHLSDADIRQMVREYFAGGVSQTMLAKKYHVSQRLVSYHTRRARDGDGFYTVS